MSAGGYFALFDDDGGNALLLSDIRRSHQLDGAADPKALFATLEAATAAGEWVVLAADYALGASFEPSLARPPPGRPVLRAWVFAKGRRLDARAVGAFLAERLAALPEHRRFAGIADLSSAVDAAKHGTQVREICRWIADGDCYQVNLTFPLTFQVYGDPLALYARLRERQPVRYGGYIFTAEETILSFSPELFFERRGSRVLTRPMKGTAARGATPQDDAAQRAGLLASAKERAENVMIVDLLRNDLSRVAEPGSVRVEKPFAIESYPTLHTMTTTVRARLRPGNGAVDMVRALFPCGSITGAPKIRAMELIDEVERDARGPYCGAIGRIDAAGDAAFNVAIRTLRLTPGENGRGRAVLGVGSAIVADSQPIDEWRECLIKGGFVRLRAGGADLIETMRFTPDEGAPLLELHLERIKASATELNYAFDRHAVRNAIQALCFEADAPARLRLAAARSGAYSLELGPLPETLDRPLRCAVLPLPVDPGDWRLRHKSSDRSFYEAGLAAAQAAGADEALFIRDDGLLTEGCFTNLFVERDGRLLTPPARLGLLPGVLRRSLIDDGRAVEAELTLDNLKDGFLIGNALRGLIPAVLL